MEIAGFTGLSKIPGFAGGKESRSVEQPVNGDGWFQTLMRRFAEGTGEENRVRQGKGEKPRIPFSFMPPFIPVYYPDQNATGNLPGNERPVAEGKDRAARPIQLSRVGEDGPGEGTFFGGIPAEGRSQAAEWIRLFEEWAAQLIRSGRVGEDGPGQADGFGRISDERSVRLNRFGQNLEETPALLVLLNRLLSSSFMETDGNSFPGKPVQEGTGGKVPSAEKPADDRILGYALAILSLFAARFLASDPDAARAMGVENPFKDLARLAEPSGSFEQWLKAGGWKNSGELLRAAEKFLQHTRPDFIREIFVRMADGSGKDSLPVVTKPLHFGISFSEEQKGGPGMTLLPQEAGDAAEFQPFAGKLELPTLFLVKEGKPLTYQQFLNQLQTVLSKSVFQKFGNMEQLTLRLHPEELGTLKIQLIQQDHGLTARIVTSTPAAKEILESQLHALRQAFVQQNITVDRIELIHVHSERKETLPQYSGDNGRNPDRQHRPKPDKGEDEKEHSFSETLLNYEI